jgi:hypothetical protein
MGSRQASRPESVVRDDRQLLEPILSNARRPFVDDASPLGVRTDSVFRGNLPSGCRADANSVFPILHQ